jgi:NDP-sugar pyrophosphorylase family protein
MNIGNNTHISGAYLWEGVQVGEQCNIDRSILAAGIIIHNQVIISAGSILGPQVSAQVIVSNLMH